MWQIKVGAYPLYTPCPMYKNGIHKYKNKTKKKQQAEMSIHNILTNQGLYPGRCYMAIKQASN